MAPLQGPVGTGLSQPASLSLNSNHLQHPCHPIVKFPQSDIENSCNPLPLHDLKCVVVECEDFRAGGRRAAGLYFLHLTLNRICRKGPFLGDFFPWDRVGIGPDANSHARFLMNRHTGRIEVPGRAIDHEFLI